MSRQTDESRNSSNTKTLIKNVVSEYINQCIQCHRCMDACPVTKDSFSIAELNQATKDGQEVPSAIKQFTFNCIQCGKCVSVCPANIRRDYMVRYIKFKIKDQKPWGHRRYLFIKGPNLTGIKRIAQKMYISLKRIITRDHACYMETIPAQKADVLFYPGCYIYSTMTVRQTLRLLNHLGCSYTVLGGVTACCGAPHMLQGEFDQADHCFEQLYQKIKTCDPKIIITACAECFEIVEQMKKKFNESFEVLSVTQYLLRYKNEFPTLKIRGKILVHDSCRFHKLSPQGSAARDAASIFGELSELTVNQLSSCCYRWNHGSDLGNTLRQTDYLRVVNNSAPTLACNCLTCYEEFKKIYTDIEIIDILQLFVEALDAPKLSE
jgi:Fe-S oxidoreductase